MFDGVSLVDCNTAKLPSWLPPTGVCGLDAQCTNHPAMVHGHGHILTPKCSCAAGAFPSPLASSTALAPYDEGCIAPLLAQDFLYCLPNAVVNTRKTDVYPSPQTTTLIFLTSGTVWSLPGASKSYPWRLVNESQLPGWLHMNQTGSVVAPSVIGEDSVASVQGEVSAAGMRDTSIHPYLATVHVLVELPTGLKVDQPTAQLLSIPVSLYVAADPVASRCNLTSDDDRPLAAVPDEVAIFTFISRDVEGIALDHNIAGGFNATLFPCAYGDDACGPGRRTPVQYVGDGRYNVEVTLDQLGRYHVRVQLNGEWLDFTREVVGTCMSGKYAGSDTTCEPCPTGSSCDQAGTTLETLNLDKDFWRLSNRSSKLYECNERMQGTHGISQCAGGTGPNYCQANLTGPLCSICINVDEHFDSVSMVCNKCTETGAAVVAVPVLMVLAIFLGVWLSTMLCKLGNPWLEATSNRLQQARVAASRLGLMAKIKLCVAYYQIVVAIPAVYDVPLPSEYYNAMHFLSVFSFDWLSVWAPVQCLGDYRSQIMVEAFLPVVMLIVFGLGSGLITALCVADEQPMELIPALRGSALATMPFVLVILFILTPRVSFQIFAAFVCKGFDFDDTGDIKHYYLDVDLRVRCEGIEYDRIRESAAGLIVLWPIGVPLLFISLLILARRAIEQRLPSRLSAAVSFLHAEYKPEYFFFELIELGRKLFLMGFVLLVPDDHALLRLVAALVVTNGYVVMLLYAAPYRERWTALLAVATNVTLSFTLLAALLVKVHAELPAQYAKDLFGFESAFPITVFLIAFNFSVLASLVLLLLGISRQQYTVRRLRYTASGLEVTPQALSGHDFHLFLSHVWGTGQDQARIIKARLLEMVLELRIFLDVDVSDMQLGEGALEQYVQRSANVLVFFSEGYATSKNCMRELRSAVKYGKPLIPVIEMDPTKGGLSMDAMREELMAADAKYTRWGFDDAWPRGEDLASYLEERHPIEWIRLSALQDVTLRLIAERLLPKGHGHVYMDGELRQQRLRMRPPAAGKPYHIYISPHNPGAGELIEALHEEFDHAHGSLPASSKEREPREGTRPGSLDRLPVLARSLTSSLTGSLSGSRQGGVQWTSDEAEMEVAAQMLVYLNGRTWVSWHDDDDAFANEVGRAIRRGIPLLLAHEMPGMGQDARHGVEFATFFETTPQQLLDADVYSGVAVPLKGAGLRPASLALLAQKLGSAQAEATPQLGRLPGRSWLRACADGLQRQFGRRQTSPLEDDDQIVMLEMRGPSSVQITHRRDSETTKA